MAGARVPQADGSQRPKADRIRAAGGHDFNRHTALVDGQVSVKVVERRTLGGDERRVEVLILLLIKGAVEVVGLAAAIAGCSKDLVIVQALGGHNGRNGVVETQPMVAGQRRHGLGQRPLGQRAAGDEHRSALVQSRDFLAMDRDVRVLFHHFRHGGGKHIAVDGQRTACRHAGGLGGVQQVAAHHLHLDFEQAGCGIRALGFQGVRADEFRKPLAFMRGGKFCGFLLVQVNLHAAVRQPQRRLAPRQAGTDNVKLHTCPLSGSPLRGGFKAVIFSQSPSQTRSPLWRSTAGPSF